MKVHMMNNTELKLKFCMKSQSNYNQKELEEIWYEILALPWDKIVLQGSSWLMSLYWVEGGK